MPAPLAGYSPLTGSTKSAANSMAPTEGVTDALDLAGGIVDSLQDPQFWVRVGYVVGGGILIVVGIAMFIKSAESNIAGSLIGPVVKGALK